MRICPMYLSEFIVSENKTGPGFLVMVMAHHIQCECQVTASHLLVWDYIMTSNCYLE